MGIYLELAFTDLKGLIFRKIYSCDHNKIDYTTPYHHLKEVSLVVVINHEDHKTVEKDDAKQRL